MILFLRAANSDALLRDKLQQFLRNAETESLFVDELTGRVRFAMIADSLSSLTQKIESRLRDSAPFSVARFDATTKVVLGLSCIGTGTQFFRSLRWFYVSKFSSCRNFRTQEKRTKARFARPSAAVSTLARGVRSSAQDTQLSIPQRTRCVDARLEQATRDECRLLAVRVSSCDGWLVAHVWRDVC